MKEIRKRIEEQNLRIKLSLISQGEWKTASEWEKFKITEDKFDQITAEQRLRFRERFNTRKEAPDFNLSII